MVTWGCPLNPPFFRDPGEGDGRQAVLEAKAASSGAPKRTGFHRIPKMLRHFAN